MELAKMTCQLQNYAHEGYALHGVEIHSTCHNCDTDIIIEDPDLQIEVDEKTKSIKLKFSKKS